MTSPAPREVRITHTYPAAASFLAAHGFQGLALLHALLQDARLDGDAIVAEGSSRALASRADLGSKDTAHRRIHLLRQSGVLERIPATGSRSPVSLVCAEHLGISVTVGDALRENATQRPLGETPWLTPPALDRT